MAVAADFARSTFVTDAGAKPSVAVVCGAPGFTTDAIRDYTHLLTEALEPYTAPSLVERDLSGRWTLAGMGDGELTESAALELIASSDCVLIQYNPFSFGRRGFAPWLPKELLRLRRRVPRPLLAVMLHESFVPMLNLRFAAMSAWQRAQLFALAHSADLIFASTGAWLDQVRAMRAHARLIHLPVPSNLPDRRRARRSQRRRLGIADETLVLAALGTDHPSRRLDDIVAASNRVHGFAPDAVLLNLGSGAPPLPAVDPLMRVERPGHLEAAALADYLAAADLFMSSFVDGVSTRRGTLMAALQHGLPVVGTCGEKTDSVLRGHSGLVLEPVGDANGYAAAVAAMARSGSHARAAMRRSIRALYEEKFDWPVHARTVAGQIAAMS